MDPQPATSFIPRQSLGGTPTPPRRSRERHSILSIIGFTIFLGAVLVTVGVYGYQWYLKASIARQSKELVSMSAQFQQATIQDLKRLDTRLQAVQSLLQSHIALSALFEYLENHTVVNVRFTEFDFQQSDSGELAVELIGVARDWSAVALQSNEFTAPAGILNGTSFSELNLDEDGNVTFNVTATVDPQDLAPIIPQTPPPSGNSVIVPTPVPGPTASTSTSTSANTPLP